MSGVTNKWFSVKRWPKGHVHIGFVRWFAEWNPNVRRLWIMRRPWPWSKRGLPAQKMKSWHFTI